MSHYGDLTVLRVLDLFMTADNLHESYRPAGGGGYSSWGLPKESNPFFHSLSSDSKFSFRLIFSLDDVSKDFAYL